MVVLYKKNRNACQIDLRIESRIIIGEALLSIFFMKSNVKTSGYLIIKNIIAIEKVVNDVNE